MPPKQRFNKESILEKAYEVFQSSGFDSVTARSVANALNCSTQPVFSYIPSMSDVRSGIIKKAEEELLERLKTEFFLDRCIAYEKFAAEKPLIFLYLAEHVDAFSLLTSGEVRGVDWPFAIYVHGQAYLIAQGKDMGDFVQETAAMYGRLTSTIK